tara:strand:- start:1535 stop:1930 length:396 start_codon:yes stop_codon:yes gene_type:complete
MADPYMPASKSDTHITPDRVYEMIENIWGYKKEDMYDPCPINGSQGLEIDWKKLNYVNPPYTLLREFVKVAIHNRTFGMTSVMLLPAKTEQQWFHDILSLGFEIKWIRRRLHFKNNKHGATQPHFLVRIEP